MNVNSLNYRLREATEKDVSAIIKLLKICELYYQEDDTLDNFRRKLLQDKDLMIVAVVNKKVIGFVMGAYDGWAATVWHLSVLPKFRKSGIAKTLLQELEQKLKHRGAQIVYGLIKKDNSLMLELLPKLSFNKGPEILVVTRQIQTA